MSMTLASFFNKLSTDTSFLQRYNSGTSPEERDRNREELMDSMGLSDGDKNVVRAHDIAAAEEALCEELNSHLDAWEDTDKCIISAPHVAGRAIISAPQVASRAIISAPHVAGRAIISAPNVASRAIISAPHVAGRAIISAPNVAGRAIISAPHVTTS